MKKPHLEKIKAALENPILKDDKEVLEEMMKTYEKWSSDLSALTSKGEERVKEMAKLLNDYKDYVEVDLILDKGSNALHRQKGQLKLDNTIMEEFLPMLMIPDIIPELGEVEFDTGPQKAFMSLSFTPKKFVDLDKQPAVVVKAKDQDFTLGKQLHYKFSPNPDFPDNLSASGSVFLAVVANECKINLDKTMFQEASGTATRLKQGIPYAKYYMMAEYLDMTPEDTRLTDIDNVFLIRHAKRLPYEKRKDLEAVRQQRKESPIDHEVLNTFVKEVAGFLTDSWYDPDEALKRGSFI